MRRAARGFTLLEVLVACALLAVLAVIGWRGLEAVLSARDRITAYSDDLRALTVAFSQIDEDLRRSWPVRLMRLQRRPVSFAVADGVVTLELLREGGGALDSTRVERVAYRVRDGRLERGFGALLGTPSGVDQIGGGSGGSAGGALGGLQGMDAVAGAAVNALPLSNAPLVWQPLLADVAAVQYRAWVRQRGWADPATLAAAQAVAAAAAPTAQPPASGAPGVPGAQGAQGPQGPQGATGPSAATAQAVEAARAAAENAAAAVEVTGIEMILLRRDGQRFVRVFPVTD